jgi:tetratricopeptide (TPR) repeat protein
VADTRIDELRRRLDRDPGSRLFAQLAEEYRKAGSHGDAIRVARGGLAQHPSYPSARLTLGRALLESGDAAGARVELETVLREAPDNILASRFLGQALEALGELGPALVQLQKTLKMAPGDRQLESRIVSLETRLRSPQAAAGAPPAPSTPAPSGAPRSGVTAPVARPAVAATPEAEASPAPTIRIRPQPEPGPWGRRAPGPPPLPATAAPAVAAPSGPPPLPPPASPLAVTERLPASTSAAYESDIAPTLPTAQSPAFGPVDETAVPTLPPGALAAEETVFEPEPPPQPTLPVSTAREVGEPRLVPEPGPVLGEARPMQRTIAREEAQAPWVPAASGATPFSSSTLAELYLKQGLVDRAVEVYRQMLAEEPGNERARSRLAEIETRPSSANGRAARRQQLERMIAGLEALLAVVRRA